jgi:hypothetical protein
VRGVQPEHCWRWPAMKRLLIAGVTAAITTNRKMNTLVAAEVVAAAAIARTPWGTPPLTQRPGPGTTTTHRPGTRSAVVGAAGPVQHLPSGIKPGFDRVTPTQRHVVDYSCHPGRRLRHWDQKPQKETLKWHYRTISPKPRCLSLQAAYRRAPSNLISDIVNCGRFGGICAV